MKAAVTLTASATLTVRREGVLAKLAEVFGGACPTYQAPFIATATVELADGLPDPAIELRTRGGRPAIHWRMRPAHLTGARVLSEEIRERGAL